MQSNKTVSWSSMQSKRWYKRLSLKGWLLIIAAIPLLAAGSVYAYHASSSNGSSGGLPIVQFGSPSESDDPVSQPKEGENSEQDKSDEKDADDSKDDKPPTGQKPSATPRPSGNTGGNTGGGGGSSGSDGTPPVTSGKKCTLHLHWAGGNGQSDSTTMDSGGFWDVRPSSPDGAFWLYDGPHNNQYDPSTGMAEYNSIVSFLTNYLNSRNCGPVLIAGYSNGGGLAAKLYCKGEDFGGRAWGLIVDDPVMDQGVLNCNPSPNIREVLFTHSTELVNAAAAAVSGNQCNWDPPYTSTPRPGQGTGWYCENNRTMTLAQYQNNVGHTSILQREFHSGGGWSNNTYASWNQNYVFWTTRFN